MALKGKSKVKWVILDDCADDDTQITEVMEIPGHGCMMRCTDTSTGEYMDDDDGGADRAAVTFVPGAALSDFIEGEPEEIPDEEDDEEDDDDDDDDD